MPFRSRQQPVASRQLDWQLTTGNWLLQLLNNPPAPDVDRRELHSHAIAHQESNEVSIDPIRDVRGDDAASLELHLVQATGQLLRDDAHDFGHLRAGAGPSAHRNFARRQNPRLTRRYRDGVLEMRRQAAVTG